MINLATIGNSLSPPTYWQDFEDLCRDLWAEIWNYPDTQKHGRQGQAQYGVDVYGRPNGGSEFCGVQCKAKDSLAGTSLTETELREEIEKAEKFTPKLSKFIITTTGPRDANIQKVAREITEERLDKGLFPVEVYSWEDIKGQLKYYPKIVKVHGLAMVVNETEALERKVEEMNATMALLSEQVGAMNTEPIQTSPAISAIYKRDLEHAEELLNKNKPEEAFEYLTKFKEDVWATAPNKVKYEILRFMASAKLRLLQNEESGKLLIEAFQYNPDDEKAMTNRALAHLLRKEFEDAQKCANDILEKNPANSDAYSILIQSSSDTEDLEDIILKIPEPDRNSLEVAYAMGILAKNRNNALKAKKWLKIAYEHDNNNSPDIKAHLAESMLLELFDKYPILHHTLINELERETLKKIAEMLGEAWNDISIEMQKSRISWIVNLSTTKRILEDLTGALADIETAIGIEPSPTYKKDKALILAENGDYEEAKEVLIGLYDEIPEAPLIHAFILQAQNEYGDAIEILNRFLGNGHDPNLIKRANEQLMDLYILNNDPDNAKMVHEILYGTDADDINGLINESRISKLYGNKDYINSLKKAKDQIKADTSVKDLLNLADEFFSNGNLLETAEIYEIFVNKELDIDLTRRLIDCYYRSGEIGKALKICKSLREAYNKPLGYISEVEVAIYTEIGDLKGAKDLVEEYCRFYPSNMEMKVSQAFIDLHLNNLNELDEFLDSDFDLNKLTLEQFIRLMYLYDLREIDEDKFLYMLYGMRRKFFQDFRAHAEYIRLLIFKKLKNEFSPIKVNLGMAVNIRYSSGDEKWLVLEEESSTRHEELVPDNPISKKLIGAYLGQEISIGEGPFSTEIVKIIDIKEKHIYALQESKKILKYSPDDHGLYEVTLSPSLDEVHDFLDTREKKYNHFSQVFMDGICTLEKFANIMGVDAVDMWVDLVRNPNIELRCSESINIEENAKLLDNKPSLVIDFFSLMTLYNTQSGENIVKAFGKFKIAQSTVNIIYQGLNDQKKYGKGNAKYFEDVIKWIETYCEVAPCCAALNINRNYIKTIGNFIGNSSIDTILIAIEEGNILYSDDRLLHHIAKKEFGADGIWTQTLLKKCLDLGTFTKEEYNKVIVQLIRFGYCPLIIDQSTLIESINQSLWSDIINIDLFSNCVFIDDRKNLVNPSTKIPKPLLTKDNSHLDNYLSTNVKMIIQLRSISKTKKK